MTDNGRIETRPSDVNCEDTCADQKITELDPLHPSNLNPDSNFNLQRSVLSQI